MSDDIHKYNTMKNKRYKRQSDEKKLKLQRQWNGHGTKKMEIRISFINKNHSVCVGYVLSSLFVRMLFSECSYLDYAARTSTSTQPTHYFIRLSLNCFSPRFAVCDGIVNWITMIGSMYQYLMCGCLHAAVRRLCRYRVSTGALIIMMNNVPIAVVVLP